MDDAEAMAEKHSDSPVAERPHRMRTFLATLWAIVGLSLLFLLGIDWLLRALLTEPESTGGLRIDRQHADSFNGSAFVGPLFREYHDSKEMTWAPYLYWRRPRFEGDYVRVDANGRRHTWTPEGSADSPRVFMFGGSTTWGTGARDDYTIPSLVAKQMHQAGLDVRISNFGESGYVSTQGVIALLLELRGGNVPDAVVFYDGANDLAAALQAEAAGTPQNEDNRRLEFNLSKRRSKLAALVLRKTFVGIHRLADRLRTTRPSPAPHLPAGKQTEELASEVVRMYAGNLAVAEGLADQFGFRSLYYWQPSVFSKTRRTPYEDSLVASRSNRERELFDHAARSLGESPELAAIPGFHDLSQAFDDVSEPVFFDFIHVSEAGNAMLAREMSEDLGNFLRPKSKRNSR